MKRMAIVLLTAAFGTLLWAGCQKSDASQIRKARVVANENLQLKKQLAEKDTPIQDLKKQIKEIEAEKAKADEEFGSTTIKTLQMVSETEDRNQALTLENEKLKEEPEKLKAR
jgi:predicted metal-binding transcription factor (methanogenesis marker protein 9)